MSHKKYRDENDCLNCKEEVTGRFCSNCGQENIDVHESFRHMVGHFISDYFHFDNKFFRSLIPLFFNPGFLTKEYWAGRRVRYIHPLRLFFFVTIIFVISTSAFYHNFGNDFKSRVFQQDPDLRTIDTVQLASLPDSAIVYLPIRKDSMKVYSVRKEIKKDKIALKKFSNGFDSVFKNLKYISFLLLPIYALIFKFLYFKRRKFYVDHLIYMMHVQTFVYCLFSITLVLPFIFSIDIELIRQISVWAIWIYIGISLHRLYHQAWWMTLLKSFVATFWLVFLTAFSIVLLAFVI